VFLAEPWPGAGTDWTMRASCTFVPEVDGEHRFAVRTNTDARITVGGREGEVHDLGAGEPVELLVEAVPSAATAFRAALEVRCQPPASETSIDRAVEAARAASGAVVVIGLDHEWETEGRDRDDLSLPGEQVALVRAVAAAQPRTVVVVLAGSPVDLSWADAVPAVLWGWYPGQGGGQAIAEVLAGMADPGGRLPCTLPATLEQTPAHLDVPPDPGHLRYGERVFVGHRWFDAHGIEPAFPFGHGLSYASFDMSPPSVPPEVDPGDDVSVSVTVRNTSTRAGTEVVQLYLGGNRPGAARHPVRSLRSFAKVALEPGEERAVTLTLGPRDLAWWDEGGQVWRAEAGTYEVVAGRSSRQLAGAATFELRAEWTAPASWWR
jgi:beta-glucosidase